MRKSLSCLALLALLLFFCGCASDTGDFVPKTEEQLEEMEKKDTAIHQQFAAGQYAVAENMLREMLKERTVSSPLYELELASCLLLQGKNAEAHDLLKKIAEDTELLRDKKSEEKAVSIWYGEQNKVFKGDVHERSTMYALLAMSYLSMGDCENARICIKNGLLADGDTEKAEYTSDYALLQYLNMLAGQLTNNSEDVKEARKEIIQSLEGRKISFPLENGEKVLKGTCFEALEKKPNVLLVFWAGSPPTFIRGGEYGEIRHPVAGAFQVDQLFLSLRGREEFTLPIRLGDINFQAITRGGRLMDQVLLNKAAVKKATKTTGNIFIVVGTGLTIAGSATMNSPSVGIPLLATGLGCLAIGGTLHIVGAYMNPAADVRFWKNLPGELIIVPLTLKPGAYCLWLGGSRYGDNVFHAFHWLEVKEQTGLQVQHIGILQDFEQTEGELMQFHKAISSSISQSADALPMAEELYQ